MGKIIKIQEASRNELLSITKKEHDLRSKRKQELDPNNPSVSNRYERSSGYKGFGIVNVDTTNLLRKGNSLVVTLQVGDYEDTVELDDVLYWIQIVAEDRKNTTPRQVNSKVVAQALSNAIDGMSIKVDCTCKDWYYRLAYQATLLGYKYGDEVNIPNGGPPKHDQRANPDNYGALCKHLYAVLSNKSWIQQVTKTLMNWFDNNIDKVNVYLGLVADKQLVMPDADLRQLGKSGAEQRKINDELRRKEVISNYFKDYMKNIQNNLVDMTEEDIDKDLNNWANTVVKRFNITDEEYQDMLNQLLDYKKKHSTNVSGNNPSTNKYNNINNESEENSNEQ